MKVTRRKVIRTLVQATAVAAVAPAIRSAEASAAQSALQPDSGWSPEEDLLWRAAAEELGEDAEDIWRSLEGGPTHTLLRKRLEVAVADGTWRKAEPLVTECVRTGVPIARIIAEQRPIDEAAFAQTVNILNHHHGIIRTRMVLTARAQRQQRTPNVQEA